MVKHLVLLTTHCGALAIGFAAGIYALPILTAPQAPNSSTLESVAKNARFNAMFTRELADSDLFHWGEGEVFIGQNGVTLAGESAPGPDYRLYLSPVFVETEANFNEHKQKMLEIGPVRTFKNFFVPFAKPIDLADFNTVIVWCESFGEFITAAKYR
ncbi:MAG: DM13 domain-containing protein [Pseudomonadota bacterium]